jgi:hypothetical protein
MLCNMLHALHADLVDVPRDRRQWTHVVCCVCAHQAPKHSSSSSSSSQFLYISSTVHPLTVCVKSNQQCKVPFRLKHQPLVLLLCMLCWLCVWMQPAVVRNTVHVVALLLR